LRPDQDERYLGGISVVRHLRVVVVDGVERGLVLQAKNEDNGVHPGGELEEKENDHQGRAKNRSQLNYSFT
jgi:hypothetical protein